MNIPIRSLLVSAIMTLSALSFAGSALCEEKPPTYTNDDIEKYRRPSDNRLPEQKKTVSPEKKDEYKKERLKQDQEYWCKKASAAKKKIEKAARDVQECKEGIAREESKKVRTSRKSSTLQSRLRKAKDHLSSAEQDLDDIEQEAHRKSIPPGWLRCQFD